MFKGNEACGIINKYSKIEKKNTSKGKTSPPAGHLCEMHISEMCASTAVK